MSILEIAICEDDPLEQKLLISILERSNISLHYEVFSSGEDFLKSFRAGKYHLIFMDIYLSGISGVETVTEVRKVDLDVFIAFTTSSLDYALEGYRLNVGKYIEKPIQQKSVLDALHLALQKQENTKSILLRIDGRECPVPQNQILYIEQRDHMLTYYLCGQTTVEATGKLDDTEALLDTPPFFRCHKSYLVNLSHVKWLNKEYRVFEMKEGGNVHIRRESLKDAEAEFESYMFEATRRLGHE